MDNQPLNTLKPSKLLCTIGLIGLVLMLAYLIARPLWQKWRQRPRVPPRVILVPSSLPDLSNITGTDTLKRALQASRDYLEQRPSSGIVSFGDRKVTVNRLIRTLDAFSALLDANLTGKDLKKEIEKKFIVLEVSSRTNEKRPILVTGYYQPVIRASKVPIPPFVYPIYGVPTDLVKISLKLFSPELPGMTLWGRVKDGQVVPYFTRAQIQEMNLAQRAPVLAYLNSPVQSLMLQIQGSGLLVFPDGSRRYIHYAASNGHPYRSIGKCLVEKGILKPSQCSWQGIEKWALGHPDAFKRIGKENPRYIFFKWERQGPIGTIGRPLTSMVSVALDPEIYPLGSLAFINVPLGTERNRRPDGLLSFVFVQDTGNAIKGPFRLDLYCGQGQGAGELAGRLKNRGRLLFLLVKSKK